MFGLGKKRDYKLKVHGRAGLTYSEGGREIFIDSEMLVGEFDMVVFLSKASQWSDGSSLTPEDRGRIRKNITNGMKRTKIDWD